jgi:ParB family transcriptional regulator, chromosome partitioning protein
MSMKVNLKDIKILSRKRQTDPQKIKDLAESIKTLGLLNPVTVTPDLRLLAGLHRTEACRLLGMKKIDVVIKDFDNLKQNLTEIDENLIRSELSILEQGELLIERDEILSSLGLRAKVGDNQWTKKGMAKPSIPLTNKDISKEIGLSDRTIRERKQIARGILPEVRDKIRNTTLADNAHALIKLTREPDYIQKIAVKNILSGETSKAIRLHIKNPDLMKMAIQQAHSEHNIHKCKTKLKSKETINAISLYHGDFRKICKGIKADSIDLCLTDPLWNKDGIDDIKDLGKAMMRVLKPSSFFISYVGTMYLPEIIENLSVSGLKYFWLCSVHYSNGWRYTFWNRRVWNYQRHFVIMYKPPLNHKSKFFKDVLGSNKKEKDYHNYQQGIEGCKYIITRFSSIGHTVIDPCMGSGSTVLACLSEKRRCIGIDIDPKAVIATKARIAEHMKNGQ